MYISRVEKVDRGLIFESKTLKPNTAAEAYMATHDVPLQLLRVKLLGLSVITHKSLVSMGNVKATIQSAL